MKADYFLTSGKLTKSATFDEYKQVDGKMLLRRMTIRDQIRKSSYSVMEFHDYAPKDIPDKMFQQGRSEVF